LCSRSRPHSRLPQRTKWSQSRSGPLGPVALPQPDCRPMGIHLAAIQLAAIQPMETSSIRLGRRGAWGTTNPGLNPSFLQIRAFSQLATALAHARGSVAWERANDDTRGAALSTLPNPGSCHAELASRRMPSWVKPSLFGSRCSWSSRLHIGSRRDSAPIRPAHARSQPVASVITPRPWNSRATQ